MMQISSVHIHFWSGGKMSGSVYIKSPSVAELCVKLDDEALSEFKTAIKLLQGRALAQAASDIADAQRDLETLEMPAMPALSSSPAFEEASK